MAVAGATVPRLDHVVSENMRNRSGGHATAAVPASYGRVVPRSRRVLVVGYPLFPFLDLAVSELFGVTLRLDRQLVNIFIFALLALAPVGWRRWKAGRG